MRRKNLTSNAVEIFHRRYIEGHPEREASLEAERRKVAIAQKIYELRNSKNLTQRELADMIGTTQSVVSRLEDADYEGHSFSMLKRISDALGVTLCVDLVSDDVPEENIRYTFQELLRALRLEKGLDVNQFAEELEIDRSEVLAMERRSDYCPKPYTLHKLSKFYSIPLQKLACLAGAVKDISETFQQEASRFAAQSESFAKLNDEEKRILNEFVKFLRSESEC